MPGVRGEENPRNGVDDVSIQRWTNAVLRRALDEAANAEAYLSERAGERERRAVAEANRERTRLEERAARSRADRVEAALAEHGPNEDLRRTLEEAFRAEFEARHQADERARRLLDAARRERRRAEEAAARTRQMIAQGAFERHRQDCKAALGHAGPWDTDDSDEEEEEYVDR